MDAQPARDVLLTAAEAAPMLGVAPGTISTWRHRGHLAERGSRPTRRRPALLYAWGDLMDCQERISRARRVDKTLLASVNRQ
jgi:hypothetical protein